MLVSDLPFRRTRCKSQWMTDLIIPLHDGLGPLTTAWSCQSISFLSWCCPRGDSPAFPPGLRALLSSGTGGFCGGCCSQLNQKEITCSHLEFGRSDGTLVTWLILFLLGWESMKVAHLHFSLWSHHTSHAWWQCCAVRQKVPIPLGFLTL